MIKLTNTSHIKTLSVLGVLMAFGILVAPTQSNAGVTIYTDEAEYEAALATLDLEVTKEGFEDDGAWEVSRVTLADRAGDVSVTNNGITWTSNISGRQIATGEGPARTGNYGFFALPHGNTNPELFWVAEPQKDGFVVSSDATMHAVGGWFDTNTYGAKIVFILDGTRIIGFYGESRLDYVHKFYGVISNEGFTQMEAQEVGGTTEDMKLIFADDFTIATGNMPADPFVAGTTATAGTTTADAPAAAMPGEAVPDVSTQFTAIETELNGRLARIGEAKELDIIFYILAIADIESVTTSGTTDYTNTML